VCLPAVLQYASIRHEHGIRTMHDARALLDDAQRLETVETQFRTVPGEGGFGVSVPTGCCASQVARAYATAACRHGVKEEGSGAFGRLSAKGAARLQPNGTP